MSKTRSLLVLSLIGSLLSACSSGSSGPDTDSTKTESDSGVASDTSSDLGSDDTDSTKTESDSGVACDITSDIGSDPSLA